MSPLHPETWIYWSARREHAHACALRLSRMLESLRAVDPLFAQWYVIGFSPNGRNRASGELPSIEVLMEALKKGMNYTDIPRSPMPHFGYTLGGWNGRTGGEQLGLLMCVGAYDATSPFPNNVSIEQDWDTNEPFPLTKAEIFGAELRAMVTAWDADWGVVSDRNYNNDPERPPLPRFWSGWIVYLAERFAEHVTPPPQAFVETVPGRGAMIYATRQTFDVDNPAHVAAADAIQAALEPIQGMI